MSRRLAVPLLLFAGVAHAGTNTDPATDPGDTATPVAPVPVDQPAPVIAPAPSPGLDAAQVNALIDERLAARKERDTAGWKDGFYIQTPDKATRLKIGGFTQFDGRFFVADSNDPHVDTFGFRSIRYQPLSISIRQGIP